MSVGWKIFLIWLVVINLVGVVIVWMDKSRARNGQWRIPEKSLFLVALLGGTPGVYGMMKKIRHKTKHKRFMIGLPLIFVLQVVLVWAVLRLF